MKFRECKQCIRYNENCEHYKLTESDDDFCQRFTKGYNSIYNSIGLVPEGNPVFPKINNEFVES